MAWTRTSENESGWREVESWEIGPHFEDYELDRYMQEQRGEKQPRFYIPVDMTIERHPDPDLVERLTGRRPPDPPIPVKNIRSLYKLRKKWGDILERMGGVSMERILKAAEDAGIDLDHPEASPGGASGACPGCKGSGIDVSGGLGAFVDCELCSGTGTIREAP